MEVIGALVIVGKTLKVIKEVWDGLQWMQLVYENATQGDKTLRSISLECNIYGESIKTIGHWLKKNQNTTGLKRQIRTTNNAITLVECSMANILLDLKKVLQGGKKTNPKDKNISKERLRIKMFQQAISTQVKRQWFHQIMNLHLVELRAHAATLHLTVSVIELTEIKPENPAKAAQEISQKTDVLQDKTVQLERRLLLRKFITKALEIKRIEIAQTTSQDESGEVSNEPATSSMASLPQEVPKKLSFFDVVQLARQKAAAEKEGKPIDELVDISNAPSSVLEQTTTTQASDDLLDLRDPNAQQLNETLLISANNQSISSADIQPTIPELDTPFPQQTSQATTSGYFELETPSTHEPEKEATSTTGDLMNFNQTGFPFELPASGANEQEKRADPLTAELETTSTEPPWAGRSTYGTAALVDEPATWNHSSMPPSLSNASLLDFDDTKDIFAEPSPPSTIAPSIFSHSSSMSSTSSHLTGISEDDVKARHSLSQPHAKRSLNSGNLPPPVVRRKIVESARPPTSMIPIQELRIEQAENLTSAAGPDPEQSPLLQSTKPEDEVLESQSQPNLSNIDEPDKQGFPWIVQAARDGNEEIVLKLLVSGANIDASHTTTQRRAISEAALQGHQNIVKLLIENQAQLDDPDSEGYTALHHACEKGHLEVAKKLLAGRAAKDKPGPQGQTALHLAMKKPYQSVVMLLIQNEANVNARDVLSQTPLHIGATKGSLAMCRHLMEEGAQIDSREAQSKTPLQLACEAGHHEVVQMMLDQSKLNANNMTFLSSFFGAVETGRVRTAECFFSFDLNLQDLKKAFFKPITLAAKSGCADMVDLMSQQDCDVNATDENGWNALHFASHYGHYQVVERLLSIHVPVDATTTRKQTPLHFAVKGDHFAVAENLLRSNNDTNLLRAEDELGETSVHLAARMGSLDLLNLLLSNDANINVENAFGWQPLHIAVAYGHVSVVERILDKGASIEEKIGSPSMKRNQTHKLVEDGYWAEARWPYPGSRAIHLACEYGRPEIVRLIIGRGAKLESACSEGWQPLHHAVFVGSSELVEILLGAGVYPHAVTSEGKTAQTIQFCTGGALIPDEEKDCIRGLVSEAMDRVKKQKNFKVALKKGSTVEEKNNLIRAVTFSMDKSSVSMAQRPKGTTRISEPYVVPSQTQSTLRRPAMPHLPFTSPLPLLNRHSVSASSRAPTSQAPDPKLGKKTASPVPPPAKEFDPQHADPEVSQALVVSKAGPQSQSQSSSNAELSLPKKSPSLREEDDPDPPITKLKHRSTTFNFNKLKPGMDVGRFVPVGIGKQTTDLTKQTLEFGKQGFELGKQGFEKSKEGLEIGKQGIEMSKQGYQKAKMFARKGKMGKKEKGKGKGKDEGEADMEGNPENASQAVEGDDGGKDNDAKSDFSVGEFGEFGEHKF